MRPPREYREIEKKRSDVKPVLMFIALAVFLVMGLELVKSGQINLEIPEFRSLRGNENIVLIDPETLKEIHQTYMEEGINTDQYYVSRDPDGDLSLPAYRRQVAGETKVLASKPQVDTRSQTRSLEDILGDIAPAAGDEEPSAFDIRKDQFRKSLREEEEEKKTILEMVKEEAPVEVEVKLEPEAKPEPPKKPMIDNGLKKIVIIIDDMGGSAKNSNAVENLQGPLTLSYLPYAKNLPERTKRARANGHELMVHMPMEPMNGKIDGGPAVLKTGQSPKKFEEILSWGLSQFDGYVGLNNHMGSRLTQDRESMEMIMEELKKKNIYFVDSVTIASSIGADVAQEKGVPHAQRDIFLDHEITKDFIKDALKKLEAVARYKGYAIAIGHPHSETIAVLKEWLPSLKERGFELVPASAVIYAQDQDKIIAEN